MKVIIVVLITLLGIASANKTGPLPGAVLFVDGFLRGALAEQINRIDKCLTNGDTIIADIDRLIQDAQDKFDITKIVTDVGSLLMHIQSSINDCHDLPDTVKSTFTNWANKLKSPSQITQIIFTALTVHKDKLHGDFSSFITHWKTGKYKESGQALGDILHTIFDLSTPSKEVAVPSVALFLDGFLRSALNKDIGRVDECLQDGDTLVTDIENIVNNLQQKFDLIRLAQDIGKLLNDIPNSIRSCVGVVDTIKDTFSLWLIKIVNPVSLAQITFKALFLYRNRLQDDASEFVAEWQRQNFESSGRRLGDIPNVLFNLCAAEPNSTTAQTLGESD